MKTKLLLLFAICFTAFGMNAQINSVALVGEAVGGWPPFSTPEDPHQLTQVDANNWIIENITIAVGNCKLRANNAWGGAGFEWAGAFPTATGTSAGDIAVPVAGVYTVTLNTSTGVYNFQSASPLPTVKLVGTAVSEATGIVMSPISADEFKATNVTLLSGLGQFDVNGDLFGGTDFPAGSVIDNTASIPVAAGVYSSVTFNISSGEYAFVLAPIYPVISITGIGVGGWGDGHDFDMTTNDGITYRYNALAIDGTPTFNEIKFRTNHSWDAPNLNYGGAGWPTGVATTTGGNIFVGASGTYDVVFDLTTGAYTFSFPVISLTGDAFGGWGDGFDFDLTTTDGANYSVASITAVATNGAKFRSNHSWDAPNLAYGENVWPSGIVSSAPAAANIPVVAGTYGVTFNRVTGAFNFGEPLATSTFKSANFRVYPNPTTNVWNFASLKQNIESIQIVDMLGKNVMTVSPKDMAATIDASSLTTGMYFAKVTAANATETIKLMKN